MICLGCGHVIPDKDNYCAYCGKKQEKQPHPFVGRS